MSSIAIPDHRVVLADRLIPRSRVADIMLIAGGALLTAGLAQVAIPLWPVPITGQTLAVLLVGATLGAVRGGASLALYALLGFIGLPFYAPQSDGTHLTGLAAVATPSFGYIVGFIPAAALVGWLSSRAWDRRFLKALATFAGGSLVVFAIGLPWLAVFLGMTDPMAVLAAGFLPFVIGGIIKALIAALLLPAAWWAAERLAVSRDDGGADGLT